MPVVSSGKVLVTGANGFVSLWLVQTLLEQGYSVRGTVRSIEKKDHIVELFKMYGNKFELVEVEDISKNGAFDAALEGVDAVMHLASPFTDKIQSPDDLIRPAVDGTVSILKSAVKNGGSIKRVVITSSMASVMDLYPVQSLFTEADWNTHSLVEVEKQGIKANPIHIYLASKTLAERAAWDYYNSVKATVGWDMVALLPGMVFGPMLQKVNSPDELNYSMAAFFKSLMSSTSDQTTQEAVFSPLGGWIDVRDVAHFHALALKTAEARDERVLIVSGSIFPQNIVVEGVKINPKIPNKFGTEVPASPKQFDVSKSQKIFGVTYKTLDCTVADSMKDFAARGWLP
ncbi:D-lactaldehyde dehydrogenase [Rhodocollybia butyracea]|uniref:D-lactaldehyde dehydrogenase n=1 Tax=Rhodocollybia butyracea TaxID=206335 RepID=A0A9P5TYM0_9AGAR|nr:D-lactaldehyde dehydrogenase [Rhodocollybia butyracea]